MNQLFDVPIRNNEIISILDKYIPFIDKSNVPQLLSDKREQYTSLEFLDKVKKHKDGIGIGHAQQLKADDVHAELMTSLALKRNCLSFAYPPGGFINWHSNGDVPGYSFIFTWSETGNGFWRHQDPVTQEIVTIQDKPGWQCKAAYFGGYDEPDKLLYHMASTDCWRITVSFLLKKHDRILPLRESIINDIMDE